MIRALYALIAIPALVLVASSARGIEPRPIQSASAIKPNVGTLRLAVSSQTQQPGPLTIWFLKVGGSEDHPADVLRFTRKQGLPLAGTNMIDNTPLVYAVSPGRYRLLAHGVLCPKMPPAGTVACSVTQYGTSFTTSAAHYGVDAPSFVVESGKITDAGEYILEAPRGSPMTDKDALNVSRYMSGAFKMRVRSNIMPLPNAFQAVPVGPSPSVTASFQSSIVCRKRPKGASLYIPFTC